MTMRKRKAFSPRVPLAVHYSKRPLRLENLPVKKSNGVMVIVTIFYVVKGVKHQAYPKYAKFQWQIS